MIAQHASEELSPASNPRAVRRRTDWQRCRKAVTADGAGESAALPGAHEALHGHMRGVFERGLATMALEAEKELGTQLARAEAEAAALRTAAAEVAAREEELAAKLVEETKAGVGRCLWVRRGLVFGAVVVPAVSVVAGRWERTWMHVVVSERAPVRRAKITMAITIATTTTIIATLFCIYV